MPSLPIIREVLVQHTSTKLLGSVCTVCRLHNIYSTTPQVLNNHCTVDYVLVCALSANTRSKLQHVKTWKSLLSKIECGVRIRRSTAWSWNGCRPACKSA